jgi:hypothetical protein
MKDDRMPLDADDDQTLPARLRADMARLSPGVQVPRSLDSAILNRAKANYARRMRFRPVFRWISVAAAVAAVVAIVLTVRMAKIDRHQPLAGVIQRTTTPRPPIPGDIDGDGKVDMLDAYILAKHIAAGQNLPPEWHVTGNHAPDQRDVDWIAKNAVSLGASDNKSGGTPR